VAFVMIDGKGMQRANVPSVDAHSLPTVDKISRTFSTTSLVVRISMNIKIQMP
jgi:hypothetical protein